MHRMAVGVIAAALFAIALGLWIGAPNHAAAFAACTRVGLIMAALWFALPARPKPVNWWLVGAATAASLFFVRMPRPTKITVLFAVPVLIAGLRSRGPRAAPRIAPPRGKQEGSAKQRALPP